MKAKELAIMLLEYSDYEIMFKTDQYYPPAYRGEEFENMVSIEIEEFEQDSDRKVIILPNKCLCYPEPDQE